MKVLKMKLFQETACYKKPFAYKVAETYPLPPYSTVIGMFHKILQAQNGEYFPMEVSVQGKYESIITNYSTKRKFAPESKKKEYAKKGVIMDATTFPFNELLLYNVLLIIHVRAEDKIIDKIYYNVTNGVETFTLGRNEDIVRLDDIKICQQIQEQDEEILQYNAYIPNEGAEVNGIKYRIPTTYTVQNELRIWNKEDVRYVEKGKTVEEVLQDEDGDLLFLANKENC